MLKLLNKWDMIVITLTAVFSIGLFFIINSFNITKGPVAHVYHKNELVATLDLNFDTVYVLEQSKYPTLYGDFEIEVKDGKVHILKESCPLGICVDFGWTDSSSLPIVCLPNNVYIIVENDNSESSVIN